jgi:hypothetical protein
MTERRGEGAVKSLAEKLPIGRGEAPKVQMEGEARLLPGDRVPDFVLPDPEGTLRYFYKLVTGQPTVLLLPANTARQEQWDEIKGFAAVLPELVAEGAALMIVSNDGVESLAMVSKAIPAPAVWFADIHGVVNLGLRSAAKFDMSGVICLVADEDQRLIALRGPEPGHAAWALDVLRRRPRREAMALTAVAPVLLLPEVLDAEICGSLVAQLDSAGAAKGAVPIADPALAERIGRIMLRRIGPEVDKVFSFDDFTFEALMLRRDDAAPEAASDLLRERTEGSDIGRGFSILLDLGTGDYQGGEILFPEYGPHRYLPGTGGAVVYSDTLLRELRPVTAGRRCLLTTTLRRPVPARAS